MRVLLLLLPLVLIACGGSKTAMDPIPTDPEVRSPGVHGEDKRAEIMRLSMEATQARLGGQFPKAISLYNQCLKADPKNAASMFELAKLYHASQNFEEAVAMAKQAVATEPSNIWYRFPLADLYKQNSQAEDAAAVYKGIVEQWPDRYEVYLDMAGAYAYANKMGDALKVYADMEKRFGLNEELISHQFSTLMEAQKYPEAEQLVQRAIAQYPSEAQYVAMLGDLYDQQGLHEKALEKYQQALALDPGNSMLRIALAEH